MGIIHMGIVHFLPALASGLTLRSPALRMQAPSAAPIMPFEDWAEGQGINAPKLAVTGVADLRGVTLLDNIEVGEELCCVPRTSCLDLSAVEGAGSPCEQMVPTPLWVGLRWYERLGCWLLHEKRRGAASHVSGYMGYLPSPDQFDDSPLEWSDEEIAVLSYPPLAVAIREQREEIQALYQALRTRGGPMASTVSEDELRWALQLVLSRAFTSSIKKPSEVNVAPPPPPPNDPTSVAARMWLGQLPVVGSMIMGPPPPPPPPPLGDGLEMAMMPMLDAFNHRSSAQNDCAYDGKRNAFVLTARAPLRKGSEAFLSYGKKSNDELLQLFGFVEESNPHDAFLSIGFEEYLAAPSTGLFASEDACERRFARLRALGLDASLLGELTSTGAPADMLYALRVLLGTLDEIELKGEKLMQPQSLETEERVWAALRGYCKMARAAMGGPRTSDMSAATKAQKEGDVRLATALRFRAEKKRLLSELENRLSLQQSRSKKAGKVVR